MMKLSTNMWIYWREDVIGSCVDEDWDNPKGRNGYNAQSTGGLYECKPKREDQEEYWGKRKTSDEVDKPLDKESATSGREGLDK